MAWIKEKGNTLSAEQINDVWHGLRKKATY